MRNKIPDNTSSDFFEKNDSSEEKSFSESESVSFNFKYSNFQNRKNNFLSNSLIVSLIVGLVLWAVFRNIPFAILFSVLFYFGQKVAAIWETLTFVTKITFNAKQVRVEYLDEDKHLLLTGETKNFIFKKFDGNSLTAPRYRETHLLISNGDERLKQYLVGEWTDDKMELVETKFNEIKSQIADKE